MILVTSGCSFSDVKDSYAWPLHLTNSLGNVDAIHLGMTSQGNGIISRKLIHKVTELLKDHSPDDILVGVMWSGIGRFDFYNENVSLYHPTKLARKNFLHVENPTGFVNEHKHWVVFNHNWEVSTCQIYYKLFESSIYSQVLTVEHILRTQWFLEKHNIKYFMSTYTGEVLSKDFVSHPEVEFLYNQINFDTFLPVVGEYEWCRDFSKHEFRMKGDNHPSDGQHKDFAEQVIIPFLKEKKYI